MGEDRESVEKKKRKKRKRINQSSKGGDSGVAQVSENNLNIGSTDNTPLILQCLLLMAEHNKSTVKSKMSSSTH